MFKNRIRMFFNELKVLVFMRSGSRHSDSDAEPSRRPNSMRGLGMGGCGWPPFVDCSSRDDEEEYYGSDPRPRSLAFEEKDPKVQAGLDAVSLTSSTGSGMRSPQCRICFQGPEQVNTLLYISCESTVTRPVCVNAHVCDPGPQTSHMGQFFYTPSESWINMLSIDVWFVRTIGQYLAEIQLFIKMRVQNNLNIDSNAYY